MEDGMHPGLISPTIAELESDLISGLREKGHTLLEPTGLVSPCFPDTFVPSAFHAYITNAVQNGLPAGAPQHNVGCDWVYRHVDQEKIGFSPIHLSTFRMLVFFGVYGPREEPRH